MIGWRHSRRNAIEIGIQFVIGLDDSVFFFRADIKARNHHGSGPDG